MKTLRTFALLVSTAALLGLGGCSTTSTKEEMLTLFNPGEQAIYVVVPGHPKKLNEIKDFDKHCGKQDLETVAASYNNWMKMNICSNITQWQIVSGVYHTKVWGMKGLKFMGAYAPVDLKVEPNDILEFSAIYSPDGQVTRPAIVTRIARKAKDATKESGCYWDGGKGATTAFIGGGAVCDGWNWRDQKFAKE